MVSAKTMANGYQPSVEGETWGESKPPALTPYGCADALTTFGCPQQTQTTHNTHPTLRTTSQSTTHLFLPFFSKSVSIENQYIYVYGRGVKAYALVSKTKR